MAEKSEFLYTLADASQLEDLFHGDFLKGHRTPRIAFVGRSNVGKSSLMNAVLGTNLAQISKKPGKTRAIHFYHWKKGKKILADLPGYGFAKASKLDRERWEEFIDLYFQQDQNLERVVLLLDSRHGPTSLDRETIEFLSLKRIPVTFVFAKADTLKTQSERALRQKEVARFFKEWEINASQVFWVSSRTQMGLKELVAALAS